MCLHCVIEARFCDYRVFVDVMEEMSQCGRAIHSGCGGMVCCYRLWCSVSSVFSSVRSALCDPRADAYAKSGQ